MSPKICLCGCTKYVILIIIQESSFLGIFFKLLQQNVIKSESLKPDCAIFNNVYFYSFQK